MTRIFWLAQVAQAKTLRLPEILLSWLQRPVSGKPHQCRCASLTVSLYSHFLGRQYEATITSAMRPNGCQRCPSCCPISVRTGQGETAGGRQTNCLWKRAVGNRTLEMVDRRPVCLGDSNRHSASSTGHTQYCTAFLLAKCGGKARSYLQCIESRTDKSESCAGLWVPRRHARRLQPRGELRSDRSLSKFGWDRERD